MFVNSVSDWLTANESLWAEPHVYLHVFWLKTNFPFHQNEVSSVCRSMVCCIFDSNDTDTGPTIRYKSHQINPCWQHNRLSCCPEHSARNRILSVYWLMEVFFVAVFPLSASVSLVFRSSLNYLSSTICCYFSHFKCARRARARDQNRIA